MMIGVIRSDRFALPSHRNIGFIAALHAANPSREFAFNAKAEFLIERNRLLIALSGDQFYPQNIWSLGG